MEVIKLMQQLNQLGVKVSAAKDGKLAATAPPGVLTTALKATLRIYRNDIAELLGIKPTYLPAPGFGPRPKPTPTPTNAKSSNADDQPADQS